MSSQFVALIARSLTIVLRWRPSSWGKGGAVLIRTGTAEDAGDLHELDGLLRGIHFDRCEILGSFSEAKKDPTGIGG